MRYLLLVLALFALVWLLRSALGLRRHGRDGADAPAELVRCAHCGVHVPRSEAHTAGGHNFCSEAHRQLGAREP